MASISTDMNFDIQNLVEERRLDGNVFSGDKDANVFSVRVYDNGIPVDLTGWSVSGSIIKPNGQTISGVTGSVSSEELKCVCSSWRHYGHHQGDKRNNDNHNCCYRRECLSVVDEYGY